MGTRNVAGIDVITEITADRQSVRITMAIKGMAIPPSEDLRRDIENAVIADMEAKVASYESSK